MMVKMDCGHKRYLLYHTVTDKEVSEYCLGGLRFDLATSKVLKRCNNHRILKGKDAEQVRRAYSRFGD